RQAVRQSTRRAPPVPDLTTLLRRSGLLQPPDRGRAPSTVPLLARPRLQRRAAARPPTAKTERIPRDRDARRRMQPLLASADRATAQAKRARRNTARLAHNVRAAPRISQNRREMTQCFVGSPGMPPQARLWLTRQPRIRATENG